MLDQTGVGIAQSIAALGATGILALLFLLWLRGLIHSDDEVSTQEAETKADQAYREQLRVEAVADRRAADERVAKLTEALAETNDLMRRSLDLNERLVDEYVRSRRTRSTDE